MISATSCSTANFVGDLNKVCKACHTDCVAGFLNIFSIIINLEN